MKNKAIFCTNLHTNKQFVITSIFVFASPKKQIDSGAYHFDNSQKYIRDIHISSTKLIIFIIWGQKSHPRNQFVAIFICALKLQIRCTHSDFLVDVFHISARLQLTQLTPGEQHLRSVWLNRN